MVIGFPLSFRFQWPPIKSYVIMGGLSRERTCAWHKKETLPKVRASENVDVFLFIKQREYIRREVRVNAPL
jgi:hypothetical protein